VFSAGKAWTGTVFMIGFHAWEVQGMRVGPILVLIAVTGHLGAGQATTPRAAAFGERGPTD